MTDDPFEPLPRLVGLIVLAPAWLPVRRAVAIEPASALGQW